MKTHYFLALACSLALTGCAGTDTATMAQTATSTAQVLNDAATILNTPATPTNTPQTPATQIKMPSVQEAAQAATVTFIDVLVQTMGVTQPQAQSSAGMLMQFAQTKMSPSAFSQLQAIKGMPAPASNAPIKNVVELGAAFQKQGVSPSFIPQMLPALLQYIAVKADAKTASTVSSALTQK